jgi:hypothetical protein
MFQYVVKTTKEVMMFYFLCGLLVGGGIGTVINYLYPDNKHK